MSMELPGARLIERPVWPSALEAILIQEAIHLWDTGDGELLIDSAWISNFTLRTIDPAAFTNLLGIPPLKELRLTDFLRAYLRLGGTVRMMFQDSAIDPSSSESSRNVVTELLSEPISGPAGEATRIPGRQLEIRTHEMGHKKRLIGLRAAYLGSANLTHTGLHTGTDDILFFLDPLAIDRLVDTYRRQWELARPWTVGA